jgi:hypothetical protein
MDKQVDGLFLKDQMSTLEKSVFNLKKLLEEKEKAFITYKELMDIKGKHHIPDLCL